MRRMLLALTGLGLALAASAPAGVRAPAPTTPAAVTATTFLVSGRGWGHGVGMSQYGALGYAQEGWTYDQILGHFYTGAELGPSPVARVRVLVAEAKAERDGPLVGRRSGCATSSARPTRCRPATVAARAEAARDRQRHADRARRAAPLPPGHGAARARPALPRPDRGLGRRARSSTRSTSSGSRQYLAGRRRAGDAERLARRGAEGAGRRGALVRARAPRSAARRSTSTPTCAARSTAASPASIRARPRPSRRRRARCCSGRGSRSTRSSTRPRAARRSTRPRSSARPFRTSSASTTRTARSRRCTAGGRRRWPRRRSARG